MRRSPPRPDAAEARPVPTWRAAALTLAVGVLVYANTLGHGFVWDDPIWLEQQLRFHRSPLDAFVPPPSVPSFPGVYRPLTTASFWLDQRLWWREPFGFHLTSVLLHAANGVLLYVLACRLGLASGPALLAALLFAVHPIHTESVAWITTRVDVLATTFVLLGTLAFLRLRTNGGTAALLAVAACAFAAAASKETGGVLPALLAASAWAGLPPPAAQRPRPVRMRRVVLGLAAAGAGLAAYLLLRPAEVALGRELRALAPPDLLSVGGAFGFYVGRFVLPLRLSAYVPDPPAGTTVALWALAGVAVATATLLRRPHGGGIGRLAVLWFALALAPSLLVMAAEVSATSVAERYLYLPSVGGCLLLAAEVARRPRLLSAPAARAGAALGLVVLAALTVGRNAVWRSDLTLWSDVVARGTRHALPYMNLGVALRADGRRDEAAAAFTEALGRSADATTRRDTHVNLGLLELERGVLDAAEESFRRANAIAPHAFAHYGLGVIARRRARARAAAGDLSGAFRARTAAEAALRAALAINPRHQQARFVLGGLHYDRGDRAGALAEYRRTLEIAPDTETGRSAAEAIAQLTRAAHDPPGTNQPPPAPR